MGRNILLGIGTFLAMVLIPCFLTRIICGRKPDITVELAQISTGRDILFMDEGGNRLVDVEEYLAHVMPAQVDASATDEYLRAQAVSLRTQIYLLMGDERVINAANLPFQYYEEQDYIDKWGKANYLSVKERYDKAVLDTAGEVIK